MVYKQPRDTKEHYIKRWNDWLDDVNILAFTSDYKLREEVLNHKEALKKLIPKVAETKKFTGKKVDW
jgi:hypothetical protein